MAIVVPGKNLADALLRVLPIALESDKICRWEVDQKGFVLESHSDGMQCTQSAVITEMLKSGNAACNVKYLRGALQALKPAIKNDLSFFCNPGHATLEVKNADFESRQIIALMLTESPCESN